MLFNFTLDPIDEVLPWGEPPDLTLHWFGFTQGKYFLQTGSDELFRYSDECQKVLAERLPPARQTPYVDYFVSRLHQDIFEIVPRILEPIPIELVDFARSTHHEAWANKFQFSLGPESSPSEADLAAWELYCEAVTWIGDRSLDSGYLLPNARIWFWRLNDNITISWDNRDKLIDGVPAWASLRGTYQLSVGQFLDELDRFHRRFLAEMRLRIEEVCRSWSRPDVQIEPRKHLLVEQENWERQSDQLILKGLPTNWAAVAAAIKKIESGAIT